jgi:hypothetical protein
MRILMLALLGAIGVAAASPTAGAAPLAAHAGNLLAPALQATPAASHGCPKGHRWVPAGYAKHGKYRPGHCAPK